MKLIIEKSNIYVKGGERIPNDSATITSEGVVYKDENGDFHPATIIFNKLDFENNVVIIDEC